VAHSATIHVPARAAAFDAALEGLTRLNQELMARQPYPPLYESGVRYKDEPRDVWRHCDDVAREKWGDCEDLSAYRAAELRVSGEDPGAAVATYQSGPHRYHAVVRRGDGTIEDPSRELGMGSNAMKKAPKHITILGDDPTPDEKGITFELIPIPGGGWGRPKGWRGVVRLPIGMLAPGKAILQAGPEKATPAAAIKSVATAVTSNPSVQNAITSELSKVLPMTGPYGAAASALLQQPQVKSLVSAGAKAAASIASKLKFW
jgi:hypothetical protein